eukprot:CAMPEP_0194094166 /NCGR_PEP_ID=MMETSP0149-20130528/53007_1 /TAXON_ID=122233 /ORGANISM="Chaetoceros debilis, Strain MM31A-1" /LENGTH=106 /DNA_ID=CAMNT_0038779719 /DNA_START=788 /DNA_END=1108 /DNA_ORIENTATION=-
MAWYCNEKCQEEHWKWHRQKCKKTTGTKQERKQMKRQARRWEKENYGVLKVEREKETFQKDKIEEHRVFLEQLAQARAGQGQDTGTEPKPSKFPSFQDYISSDEDE